MILSEFESQEGYDAELNWQTKSRLDMLSSRGMGHAMTNGATNGHSSSNSGGLFGAGPKKAARLNSLLDPEIEMSHSEAYHNDSLARV
jgi:hypothetical protein